MNLMGKVNAAINFPSAPRPSGGRSLTNAPGTVGGGASATTGRLSAKMSSADRASFGRAPSPSSFTKFKPY